MDRYALEITYRPLRIASLLGRRPSTRIINNTLEINTRLWGGIYNLICPTDGESLSEEFLQFIRHIMPDAIVFVGDFQNRNHVIHQLEDSNIRPSFLVTRISLKQIEDFGIGIEGIFDNWFTQFSQRVFLPAIGIVDPRRGKATLLDKFKFGIPPQLLKDYCEKRANFVTTLRYNRELKSKEAVFDTIMGMIQLTSENLEQIPHRLGRRIIPQYAAAYLIRRNKIVVIGDDNTMQDVCYFWNLRASCGQGNIEWISIREFDALPNIEKLQNLLKTIRRTERIVLTSSSDTVMDCIASKLKNMPQYRRHLIYRNADRILRMWPELSLSGERRTEHIMTESGDTVITTGSPRSFEVVYPRYEARWVVDLRILRDRTLGAEGLVLPNLPQFWGILTPEQRSNLRPRIETDKFSFQITPRTERIRLQMPTNWDIIQNVFKASFSNVGFSDQGRYMNRVLELFGGLAELCRLLTDPRITCILDEFLKHHGTGQIPKDKSYRRALSLDYMHKVVSARTGSHSRKKSADNIAFVEQTIEGLIKNGAIHSGYVLDCSHCSLEEWYPIDEVTETYRCRRCLSTQRRPLSPLVHFRLNEALYQAYVSNFLIPIQTLEVLR